MSKPTTGRYVALRYDIPQRAEIGNPSGRLRRHGFRDNLSCWVLPDHQMPYIDDLIDEMNAAGCNVRHNKFDPEENEDLRRQCREALTIEVARLHTSLIESIANAKEQLEVAESAAQENNNFLTERERDDLQRKKKYAIQGAINRAGEGLDAAISCAMLFDEKENIADLLEGLQLALTAQKVAFEAEVMATPGLQNGTRKPSSTDKVFGHPVYRVIRWMGTQGWDKDRAGAALKRLGAEVSQGSVRRFLRMGRRGEAPNMEIQLTEEQITQLSA